MKAPGGETCAAFTLAGIVAIYSILAFDGADAFYRLWPGLIIGLVAGCLYLRIQKTTKSF